MNEISECDDIVLNKYNNLNSLIYKFIFNCSAFDLII